MRMLLTSSVAALLVGCGGGGGGDDDRFSRSSYTVYAQTPNGFAYSVCVDGIDPPHPNSPQGRQVTDVLMDYYDLVGVPTVVTSFELSCIESDPRVNEIVTIDEYNDLILPTVLGRKAPVKERVSSSPEPADVASQESGKASSMSSSWKSLQ